MTDVLIGGIGTLITMDDDRRILHDVDLRLSGGKVAQIGFDLDPEGAELINGAQLLIGIVDKIIAAAHIWKSRFDSFIGVNDFCFFYFL